MVFSFFVMCGKKGSKSRINDEIIRSHHLLLFEPNARMNKTSVAHDFGGFEMNLRLLSTTKRLFSSRKGWHFFDARQSSYAGTHEPCIKHAAPHMDFDEFSHFVLHIIWSIWIATYLLGVRFLGSNNLSFFVYTFVVTAAYPNKYSQFISISWIEIGPFFAIGFNYRSSSVHLTRTQTHKLINQAFTIGIQNLAITTV